MNSTAIATVFVLNRGSAPGVVESVEVSGAAFKLFNLTLLPATIDSGQVLQFQVRYSPQTIGADTGALHIVLGAEAFDIELKGVASRSCYRIRTSESGAA